MVNNANGGKLYTTKWTNEMLIDFAKDVQTLTWKKFPLIIHINGYIYIYIYNDKIRDSSSTKRCSEEEKRKMALQELGIIMPDR